MEIFADPRFIANVIAAHGLVTVVVLASIVLREMIQRGGTGWARWTGAKWLEAAGEHATRHIRNLVFWLAVLAVLCLIGGGVAYHIAGRDVRIDLRSWWEHLTIEYLTSLCVGLGECAAIIVAVWLAGRVIRRQWPNVEVLFKEKLGSSAKGTTVAKWFRLFELYQLLALRLAAVWLITRIAGAGSWSDRVAELLARLLTILVGGRLLTLAFRVFRHGMTSVGNTYLLDGKARPYWERVSRLFPFGEKCFETAVYISVAALCVKELHFIEMVADLGPRIVQCIGIFFATRVLIELTQVMLGEVLGLHESKHATDQKAQTLVPLLASLSQYVLYFGAVLAMLGVLGIDTRPILAGAGIIGLAVGLGAQNLVTDLVSGFFILFENQYLVGDYVQIGEATGVVEGVGIRLTKIRDPQGKLFILPNGQVKGVVSYSKGYVNAVVDLPAPSGADLEGVFRAMAEAGRRIKAKHPQAIMGETQIQGLVQLGAKEMTIRAVTRCQPGQHLKMEREYRLLLRQALREDPPTTQSLAA